MSVARRVQVSGRVQGVFFRAWTQEQARALGVAGWIRNRADGGVEAVLEGAEDAIAALVERMRHGPPGARVDRLEIDDCAPSGEQHFTVRR